jgi:hypothetical protein
VYKESAPTAEQDPKAPQGWGYDRIAGALSNLGHQLSDQTVGNILRRHGIAPAPKRSQTTTWKDFTAAHRNVLAGADFFTVEVLTWRGLVTYYVLFFIHLESRRVNVAGVTRHPDHEWMEQIARSATQESWGYLHPCRYNAIRPPAVSCLPMVTGNGQGLQIWALRPDALDPLSGSFLAFALRGSVSRNNLISGPLVESSVGPKRAKCQARPDKPGS